MGKISNQLLITKKGKRFPIRRNGQIGFTNKVTKKFVAVNHCMIMNNTINKLINNIENFAGETTQLSIRASANTNSFLIQPKLKNPEIKIKTGQKTYTEKISKYDLDLWAWTVCNHNTRLGLLHPEAVITNVFGDKRDAHVSPLAGVLYRILDHRALMMSSERSDSIPELEKTSWNSIARLLRLPLASPNVILATGARCLTTPGESMLHKR